MDLHDAGPCAATRGLGYADGIRVLGEPSMTRPDPKKQHERFLLDHFFQALRMTARIVEEREGPDFLVRLDGREIGVELTRLFVPHRTNTHPPQANESSSDRFVLHAQRLYQESAGPPVHVRVCFAPRCNLTALNRDGQKAATLSTFVRKLDLGPGQVVDCGPEECDRAQLPKEISFVHALGVPDCGMARWVVARAGWAAPLTIEALQSRIDEKSKRLNQYKEVVAENWLIVVSDGTRPSQLFTTPSILDASQVSSPFSKTFYFGYPDRAIIELGASATHA